MGNFFDFREELVSGRRKARDADSSPAPSKETLSVSQLTRIIDSAIQGGVPSTVHVHGELSNVNLHQGSGHLYFTLKDSDCCIECVMWKSDLAKLKFEVNDGEQVLVSGSVAVYGVRGRYQLYARRIEPMGKGALELAYRQLYAKLEAEGLFDPARRRPLPRYPMCVALVTSRDGAAVADMLKVLRRYPWVRRLICHVPVQGDGAAQQIAAMLNSLSRQSAQQAVDVVIVARGGGSLEDLWAFNEEHVARAIVTCCIPVVSGIGHEVDTSIADLVADYHAHTPTEAAQVVVAGWRTVSDDLERHAVRLQRSLRTVVGDCRQRLHLIQRHEFFRRPAERMNQLRQRLDDRQRELARAMMRRLHHFERLLATREVRLRRHHPRHTLLLCDQKVRELELRLSNATHANLHRLALRLSAADAHLQAVSPQAVLKRGYSITTLKKGGKVVRSVNDVRTGDALVTRVTDGQIESRVEDQKQLKLFE